RAGGAKRRRKDAKVIFQFRHYQKRETRIVSHSFCTSGGFNSMRQLLCLLCVIICLVIPTACGRSQSAALYPATANSATPVTIPFDLIDNRIVIDVRLDGKGPYRFIFDSGAVSVVSMELAREIGLKVEGLTRGGTGVGESVVEHGQTKISDAEVA